MELVQRIQGLIQVGKSDDEILSETGLESSALPAIFELRIRVDEKSKRKGGKRKR